MTQKSLSYFEVPCDRCGGKRSISKGKNEKVVNSFSTSNIQVSKVTCTNLACQDLFDKQRAIEEIAINERRVEREERAMARRDNIAKTIAVKREFKFGQKST